jgi:hypothetical protein
MDTTSIDDGDDYISEYGLSERMPQSECDDDCRGDIPRSDAGVSSADMEALSEHNPEDVENPEQE